MDIHFVREQVTAKKLKVQYVPTQHQTVDIFTKSLSVSRFEELQRKLCVVNGVNWIPCDSQEEAGGINRTELIEAGNEERSEQQVSENADKSKPQTLFCTMLGDVEMN